MDQLASRLGRRRLGVAALVAVLIVILAACAAGGSPIFQNVGKDLGGQPAAPAAGASAGSAEGRSGSATGNDGLAAPADQKIVKTGEISVQVANVAAALARVRTMAVSLGGYIGGAQAGTLDEAATLTLRIPAARFDDAISQLEGFGKVLSQSQREEDVTSAVVDLDARITNLKASEVQYRDLLGKAQKVDDILAVQSRLDDVRGQIEQLSAQLKALNDQADLSTLTVSLQPEPKPIQAASEGFDPGATVSSAVGALLQVGQSLVIAAIWVGIVGLPILVVLAILALILMRVGVVARRRPPVAPEPPVSA